MVAVVSATSTAEVVLKRVAFLGSCTEVARCFFFSIALFLREARFLSYFSLEFAEELSFSSSCLDRSQKVLVLVGLSSRKGWVMILGLAARSATLLA